jgi:hypothetical protein
VEAQTTQKHSTIDGYCQLRKALELLARSPSSQSEFLQELGTAPSIDELALIFDDSYAFFRSSAERSGNSLEFAQLLSALSDVDDRLTAMSSQRNKTLWSIEALSSPEWDEVRKAAGETLALFD